MDLSNTPSLPSASQRLRTSGLAVPVSTTIFCSGLRFRQALSTPKPLPPGSSIRSMMAISHSLAGSVNQAIAAFSVPATPALTIPVSSKSASIKLSRIATLSSTTNALRANSGLLATGAAGQRHFARNRRWRGGASMKPQAQQELAALRQALTEAREQLSAARAQAAERQSLLKKERAARALAERLNALKDEFLAIVSHELRGPLSAIAGWARILRLGTSEEDFDKGLEVIDQSVQAQTKLIEDLLDISRITSGQLRLHMQPLEPRSFIDAAAEAVRPAADAKGLHIRKVLDLAAGPIAGDPSRLQQVMVNLIANAVKFTPEQGRIELALRKHEDQVQIRVAETNIGNPADFLPHVFDRFRQADASNQGR